MGVGALRVRSEGLRYLGGQGGAKWDLSDKG